MTSVTVVKKKIVAFPLRDQKSLNQREDLEATITSNKSRSRSKKTMASKVSEIKPKPAVVLATGGSGPCVECTKLTLRGLPSSYCLNHSVSKRKSQPSKLKPL